MEANGSEWQLALGLLSWAAADGSVAIDRSGVRKGCCKPPKPECGRGLNGWILEALEAGSAAGGSTDAHRLNGFSDNNWS